MTTSNEEVFPLVREFPKDKIFEELKEKTIKEVKVMLKEERDVDPIQKKRDERNWKKSLGYYALNPHKFGFSIRNL